MNIKSLYIFLCVAFLVMLIISSCGLLEPSAKVTITGWDQTYYEYLGEWSDYVKVWYNIKNTGNVDIDYYEIWFVARCSGGGSYEDWTNGLNLREGHSHSDYTFITVPGSKVESVKISDVELTAY